MTQRVRTGKFQTDGCHRHSSQGTEGQGRETEVAGSGADRLFLDFTRQRGGWARGTGDPLRFLVGNVYI